MTPAWCPLSPIELHGVDEDEVALGVEGGRGGGGRPGECPHFPAMQGLQVGVGEELQADGVAALQKV